MNLFLDLDLQAKRRSGTAPAATRKAPRSCCRPSRSTMTPVEVVEGWPDALTSLVSMSAPAMSGDTG